MKRRLAILAAALALGAAAGCSPATDPPASAPPTTAAPIPARADGAPGAQDVVDAFAAAGLSVPDPRDDSGACAGPARCSELITTDAIAVYVFADDASAARFAATGGPDAHRAGVVVLDYTRTPRADRSAYENTLTSLL